MPDSASPPATLLIAQRPLSLGPDVVARPLYYARVITHAKYKRSPSPTQESMDCSGLLQYLEDPTLRRRDLAAMTRLVDSAAGGWSLADGRYAPWPRGASYNPPVLTLVRAITSGLLYPAWDRRHRGSHVMLVTTSEPARSGLATPSDRVDDQDRPWLVVFDQTSDTGGFRARIFKLT